MNTITYNYVHNAFKLNGFHFDKEDLCRVAYSFIKEGEDFEKPVGNFLLDWFDDKKFITMQTSGSTGIPKIINVQKQAMVNSALATGRFFDLYPGQTALHCLPVNYVAGKMMLVRAMILGLDLEFVAPSLHPLIGIDGAFDFAAMVPLQAETSYADLHRIKKLIVGGAKINAKLETILKKIPKIEVFETYGMTETVSHIAAKRVGELAFSVLPEVTISYDDANCLVIHAPKISADLIATNDIVELIDENKFIFLGRIDNTINSGGIKILPEQVEAKLSPFINAPYFVTSKEDASLGEKVILVIEGKPYKVNLNIFEVLSKYEKPKEIVFQSKFSYTENGKIIRHESYTA